MILPKIVEDNRDVNFAGRSKQIVESGNSFQIFLLKKVRADSGIG